MGIAIIIPGANFSNSGLGKVTLKNTVPLRGLSISGVDVVVGANSVVQYMPSYDPVNTSQRGVSWSISNGNNYATIDATTGVLSVLPGANSSSVTIRCASTINQSVFAEKTINVTYVPDADIPDGAIQCDLIYGDGYSAFIETGLIPLSTMSFECDICWVVPDDDFAVAFGYYFGGVRWAPLGINQNTGVFELGYGGYYAGDTFPGGIGCRRYKHKGILTPTGATIETYNGDVLINTTTFTYSEAVTFAQTIGLFGRKGSATSARSGEGRSGLGRIKFYSDNHFGTLIADYNPCFYMGNFGMWDAVSETMKIGNNPGNIRGFGFHWNTYGFWPNAANTLSTTAGKLYYLSAYRGFVVSPMFRIPAGCSTIRFNAGEVHSPTGITRYDLMTFDSNGDERHWWTYNVADREVTGFSDSTYVRMHMPVAMINSCYIYDVTNGQFIWKGINI